MWAGSAGQAVAVMPQRTLRRESAAETMEGQIARRSLLNTMRNARSKVPERPAPVSLAASRPLPEEPVAGLVGQGVRVRGGTAAPAACGSGRAK